jgi:hypothetical protein
MALQHPYIYDESEWYNGEPAPCGRRVCCVCKTDMGPAPGIPDGEITHTYCPICKESELAKIRNLNLGGRK